MLQRMGTAGRRF